MRKISFIFLALLFTGCSNSHPSEFSGHDFSEELCDDDYCVDEISKFEEGFYLSPVDLNAIASDSDGNIASTNTLLVKFNDNASVSEIEGVLDSLNTKISAFIPYVNIFELIFDCDSIEQIEENISTLLASGIVELAEKNYVAKLESLDIESSNENGLWGFEIIKLAEAYHFIEQNGITLHPVRIAVLDAGFNLSHKEFSGLEIADQFDFGDNDNDVYPSFDKEGELIYHGTQVAGIILAQNNDDGLNGIVPNASLLAYKIFPNKSNFTSLLGSTERSLITATIWATKHGASVINYSGRIMAINNVRNPLNLLRLTIINAHQSGIVFVASAGNGNGELYCTKDYWPEECNIGDEATYHFPSAFPEVISVGATGYDKFDIENRTEWSNYSQNDDPNILDLAAPGDSIALLDIGDSYTTGLGTSFSSPMVAGLSGLLRSIRPELNPDEIRRIIYESATEILVTYPDGVFHNWRRINVLEAVKKATHDMILPNHGIGKSCVENNDCDFDLFCISSVCTEFCFEEKDRGQDLGWTCDNCNLFCECPIGTTCTSFLQPSGRIPLKICL